MTTLNYEFLPSSTPAEDGRVRFWLSVYLNGDFVCTSESYVATDQAAAHSGIQALIARLKAAIDHQKAKLEAQVESLQRNISARRSPSDPSKLEITIPERLYTSIETMLVLNDGH